ncbi:YjbF family lipoprotein [Roseovarius salis]|uniref:YjbF family lipoprotein n=1 Tax=Roseovarius salis TaxID=3376063 RepID=UPI0037CCAC78
MSVTRLLPLVAVIAALILPGCSSQESTISPGDLSKELFQKIRSARQQPTEPPDLSRFSATALRRTDDPLAQLMFPTTKAAAVMRIIESNGRYDTWAAWGISDRRSVTTKDGIITATRAVPPDLMSADVDGVLELVTQRREGTAQYTQRYLDGDHGIVEAKSTCVVSRGYPKAVKFGEIDQPVLQMFSSCVSADRQFVDLYLVNRDGRIVQSRQWVGPELGFAVMRHLR